MSDRSAIYESVVVHQRFRPKGHRLRYRVYSMLFDLAEIDDLADRIPILSRNRFNLVSFHDRDFGPRDGSDLTGWIRGIARTAGVDGNIERVELLAFPRILGYAFNPITTWFGYDSDDALSFVLYEVHNTFGQEHRYGFVVPPGTAHGPIPKHVTRKQFHVSPFMDRTGTYRMTLSPPASRYGLTIEYFDDDGARMLTASQHGVRSELTSWSILKQFVTKPLLTIKVIAGIHYEAAKVWFKGAKYRSVPEPISSTVDLAVVESEPVTAGSTQP